MIPLAPAQSPWVSRTEEHVLQPAEFSSRSLQESDRLRGVLQSWSRIAYKCRILKSSNGVEEVGGKERNAEKICTMFQEKTKIKKSKRFMESFRVSP